MDLTEYLSHKRVVIVGPSDHILTMQQRDLIESYDVVVRLNKAIPVPKHLSECLGERTDIIMTGLHPKHCISWEIDLWLKLHIEWIVSPFPHIKPFKGIIKRFRKFNKGRIKFECRETAGYIDFTKCLGTRPNTGFAAISHLLSYNINELYITGMTFFQTKYISEYSNISWEEVVENSDRKSHKQAPQITAFFELLRTDNRIKTDEYLGNMFKENENG